MQELDLMVSCGLLRKVKYMTIRDGCVVEMNTRNAH
jgi:hypothetical protein